MFVEKLCDGMSVKKLSIDELKVLANEIRDIIIKKCSIYSGHLGSNLGIIELTIALHFVFDFPKDKVVFDTTHQTFTHKILTGRGKAFIKKELYNTVSEFANPKESNADLFHIGHTSTSISLACGLAKARDISKKNEKIIAVIGDASLGGGPALEGLNISSCLNSQFLLIVNDNEMSVFNNQGSLYKHLADLRKTNGLCENNIFKNFGFEYKYVENGNDVGELISVLNDYKDINRPTVIHIHTKKGKGYTYAENNPSKWHFTKPFDVDSGEILPNFVSTNENFGTITYDFLSKKMKNEKIAVVSASTPSCFGFSPNRVYGTDIEKQFLDVGIEEQNAILIACGMAKNGFSVVFGTWATFYQRAYDQIAHEACINKLPLTFIVTNASIKGDPNDTHAGVYDIAMFSSLPNLLYLSPVSKQEYLSMLEWSIENNDYPVAIRIPWNGVINCEKETNTDWGKVKYKIEKYGNTIAIIALGSFYKLGYELYDYIKNNYNIESTVINPRYANRTDDALLKELLYNHKVVVTLEDGIIKNGYGSMISQFYSTYNIKVINFGFKKEIPTYFSYNEFIQENGLEIEQIANEVINTLYKTE